MFEINGSLSRFSDPSALGPDGRRLAGLGDDLTDLVGIPLGGLHTCEDGLEERLLVVGELHLRHLLLDGELVLVVGESVVQPVLGGLGPLPDIRCV